MVNGTTTNSLRSMTTLMVYRQYQRGRKRFSWGRTLQDCNREPDSAGNGEKIHGVAPEAQVMFMRVFDRQKHDLLLMQSN